MLNVHFPRHGAILNHNHGKEDANGLTIEVRGIASVNNRVTVNGVEAERKGRAFSAKVTLTAKFNDITVQATNRPKSLFSGTRSPSCAVISTLTTTPSS